VYGIPKGDTISETQERQGGSRQKALRKKEEDGPEEQKWMLKDGRGRESRGSTGQGGFARAREGGKHRKGPQDRTYVLKRWQAPKGVPPGEP